MNMNMKNNHYIDAFLETSQLRKQVKVNLQTFFILVHDPGFKAHVIAIRLRLGIPANGFRAGSSNLKKWLRELNRVEWDDAMREVFIGYPHLTENFREHIEIYMKFGHVSKAPILNYDVYNIAYDDQKRDWLTINIYSLLTEKEWRQLREEVNSHFSIRGVKRKQEIANLKKKLASTSKQKTKGEVQGEQEYLETDEDIATKLYHGAASLDSTRRFANRVKQHRKRMGALKKQRLG